MSLLCLLLFAAACSAPVLPRLAQPGPALPGDSAAGSHEVGQRNSRWLIQQMGGVYPDADLASYVDRVGQSLVGGGAQAGLNFHFKVLNDLAPNSASLPGGLVAISRGLLLNLTSEAQLAAVLGFEIGHIRAGHHLQAGERDAGHRASPELSAGSEYAELALSLFSVEQQLLAKSYDLAQEVEADQLTVDMLVASGYLPDAVPEVLEGYLRQQDRADGDGGRLFRAHPVSPERLDRVRSYIAKYYPVRVSGGGATDFSARTEPLRQSAESFRLYNQGRQLERKGQFAEAIATYHQALQVAPEDALILAGLGLAYLRTEDMVPARRYLLKAVNLQGDYAKSRLGLGYLYLQKWQYAQALNQLEESLRLLPTVEGAFLLGEAQQNIGQQDKARDLYRIVASVDLEGKLGRLAEQRLTALEGE
jgi:predicted Zn-dependent protease